MPLKKLIVKCSHCSLEFNYYASEYRPFCSERCKMIDLGHWLQENYKVPSEGPSGEEDTEEISDEEP